MLVCLHLQSRTSARAGPCRTRRQNKTAQPARHDKWLATREAARDPISKADTHLYGFVSIAKAVHQPGQVLGEHAAVRLAKALLRLLLNCGKKSRNTVFLARISKKCHSQPQKWLLHWPQLGSNGLNNESAYLVDIQRTRRCASCQRAPQAPPQLHTTNKTRQRLIHLKVGCLKVLSCPASP
jgi:hypothetical protein